MDFYIDIVILTDPDLSQPIIMNAAYTNFHKVLFDIRSNQVGVSFPHHKKTLGDILRMHGSMSDLQELQKQNLLLGLVGYCEMTGISQVPDDASYHTVSRMQINMSQSKLRRLVKRGSITEEESKRYNLKLPSLHIGNPYVDLVSGSNGQKHRRYIKFGEIVNKPTGGTFDQFGFSKVATIPCF